MIPRAFLLISVVSLLVYLAAWWRIRGGPAPMLRTAVCRVLAAAAYVGLGIHALATDTGMEALLVFGAVQVLWWVNAAADTALVYGNKRHPARRKDPP